MDNVYSILGAECFLLLIHRRTVIQAQISEAETASENLCFIVIRMDKIPKRSLFRNTIYDRQTPVELNFPLRLPSNNNL